MTVLICCDFVCFFIFWLWVKYLRMFCIYFDTCIHSNYPFAHSKFMLLVLILIFLPFTWQAHVSSSCDGNQLCIDLQFLILTQALIDAFLLIAAFINALTHPCPLTVIRDFHLSKFQKEHLKAFLSLPGYLLS